MSNQIQPEVKIGGIVVLIDMPGDDWVIGEIDEDSLYDDLMHHYDHFESSGLIVNGVYALTIETREPPEETIEYVKSLVKKYYRQENNNELE